MALPLLLFNRRPGKLSFQRKLLGLFGDNLIQYLPLNESPAGPTALTFNGTSTKVDFGSDASLDDLPAAGDFTVEFWVNITTLVDFDLLFGKGSPLTTSGWHIVMGSDGSVYAYTNFATTDATGSYATISAGAWAHVVYFFDFSASKHRMCVNGTWADFGAAGSGAYQSDAASNLVSGIRGANFAEMQLGWARISNNDRYDGTSGTPFTPPSRTTTPTDDANTVSLWPMNEGYGPTAGDIGTNDNDGTITDGDWGSYPTADDKSPQANDGAYTGTVLANSALPSKIGGYAPYFDGVNDEINAYSAAFSSDFSGAAGTLGIWAKVANVGVWTDATLRYPIRFYTDDNNEVRIFGSGSNNISWGFQGGGAAEKFVTKGSLSTTDWMFFSLTWDDGAPDEMIAYYNGAPEGSAQTPIGTHTGVLTLTTTWYGKSWSGWLAHVFCLNRAATAAEVLQVYNWGV